MRNLKNKEINSVAGASFSAAECEASIKLFIRAKNGLIHNFGICSPSHEAVGTCRDEAIFRKGIEIATAKVIESCPAEIINVSDLGFVMGTPDIK